MGCLCFKSKQLSSLRPGSNLYEALRMETTRIGGHRINPRIETKLISENELKKMLDKNIPEDFVKVLSPPLSNFDMLKPYLYLTSIGGLTRENLTNNGITMIINATYEWPLIQTDTITSYRVPVDDGERDDISIYFEEVADKIDECRCIGGKCVVHCMAGACRSTTLVLAYILKYERMSLRFAYKSVRKRRECARPNLNFWEQLIRYETKVRGKHSVIIETEIRQGVEVKYPDIYKESYNDFYEMVIEKQLQFEDPKRDQSLKTRSQKHFNELSLTYE